MKRIESLCLILLTAAPCVFLLPACGFSIPAAPFAPGDPPRTSAIFCDVEAGRRCSTADDRLMGIDVSRPSQDGFWVGKSSPIGLDYSSAALAACGGQPQAVVYQDAFPNGSPVCLNPSTIPQTYATVNYACKSWCYSQGWIDGDGNEYNCTNIAWRSNGADTPFAGACSDSGTLRADFADPRKIRPTNAVTWTAVVGATANGSNLTKTDVAGWGNAGAISTKQLTAGDGSVLITASETTSLRIFGLGSGSGALTFEDVEFGLVASQAGLLIVVEGGVSRGAVGSYVTGDVLEVAVVGSAVQYLQNGQTLFTSTLSPSYPLRVEAALNSTGATIQAARITF